MKTVAILLSLVLVSSFSTAAFAQEDDICGIAAAYYNDSIGCEKIPQHCAQSYFDIKANEKRISKNIAVYDSRLLLKSAQAGLNNCMNPTENINSVIPHECRAEYQKIAGAKSSLAVSDDNFNIQIMTEKLNQYTTKYKQCVEDLETSKELPITEIRCGKGTVNIDGICQVDKPVNEKPVIEKTSKKSFNLFEAIFKLFGW